jgi:PIN domain nuclease of toxin-antitoxin system
LKYLLDTHIWIWGVSNPGKLSQEVSDILAYPSNEFFISSISVWEFLMLVEKERITITEPLDDWLNTAINKANISEIPIDKEIAIQSRKIILPHQDPADRFIAATALINELKLVTSDSKLSQCQEISVLYNKT